jgi:hypothetical protein
MPNVLALDASKHGQTATPLAAARIVGVAALAFSAP